MIGIPKDELYLEYVRQIGDNFEIVSVRDEAAGRWKKTWEARGTGWPCEYLGPASMEGYTLFTCYYGSSTYDSAQMARLIDFVIFDCKLQDIETMTPDEIARLKAGWADAPDDKSV